MFDRARKLLEALCTEAIAVEHEAARRAREEDPSVGAMQLKGDGRGATSAVNTSLPTLRVSSRVVLDALTLDANRVL